MVKFHVVDVHMTPLEGGQHTYHQNIERIPNSHDYFTTRKRAIDEIDTNGAPEKWFKYSPPVEVKVVAPITVKETLLGKGL